MKYLFTFSLILITIFLFINCNSHSESPTSCLENPDAEGKLIVIVGEKIDITEVENPTEGLSLPYSKFIANYKILQKICGDYENQNITFTVFDHYGFPAFGNHKQALLFLNKYKNDDTIYHEIYQYFPLYMTKDGRWASSYQYQEYSKETNVKPEKIEFAEEVSYSIEGMTRTTTQSRYPEPYYKIDKKKQKSNCCLGQLCARAISIKKRWST